MNRYLLFFLIICCGFQLQIEAAEIFNAGEELQFLNPTAHPDDCWSDMLNLAETRASWFQSKVQFFQDTNIPLRTKIQNLKKIFPSLDERQFSISSAISAKKREQIEGQKLIDQGLSDLIYSSFYWQFLERTINYFSTDPTGTIEAKKQLLPHLVREIVNFEEYALYDLQENPQQRYASEEFFINRAIFKECESLAAIYQVPIAKVTLVRDAETNETIDIADVTVSEMKNSKMTEGTSNASGKSSFFMEQVLYFRRNEVSASPLPDFNHPMLKAFQTYILPVTGPEYIQPALKISVDTSKKSQKKTPSTKSVKKKNKKNKKKNNKKPPSKPRRVPVLTSKKASIKPTIIKQEQGIIPQTSVPIVIEKVEFLPDVKKVDVVIEPKAPQSEPTQKIKVFNPQPRRPFVAPPMNIREIGRLNVQHHVSTKYNLGNKGFDFPFKAKNPICFQETFLRKIKALTHLSPKTDKLPNIAQGAITFHFQTAGKEEAKTIKFEELFLSGGKFFGRDGFAFKDQYKVVNAMQDMLTPAERIEIHELPMGKKSIPLGIAIEKHLRRLVIQGPWKNNCLDSEAIFLLHLVKNLPDILRYKLPDGSSHPITIYHAVLSISSYRDSCPNCQRLINPG